LNAVTCFGRILCLAVGGGPSDGGMVDLSVDGGKTWTTRVTGSGSLNAIDCVTADRCFVVGDGATVLENAGARVG
jgi:photosystem II stability/assembly factor-like uncharacterized protein